MPEIVQFTAPGRVDVVEQPPAVLEAGAVRLATWFSGISAGTELTAYRGSNPYLAKTWDAGRRLFVEGEPSFGYPVRGWGYQEVGEVVEVADGVDGPKVGDVVYGIWGHRADVVVPAAAVAGHTMPDGVPPVHGVFARVGAIALNAVLGAGAHVGESVVVFGQGVIGLLAARLASLDGADVTAVDTLPGRLELSRAFGAVAALPAAMPGGVAGAMRDATGNIGADAAIELSGSHLALNEAIRSVRAAGRVVAAGFYQGEAAGLRLGEEFHHNRVEIVASQIGGVPPGLAGRWDHERLLQVFMRQVAAGRVDVSPLLTHVVDVADAADAYALLDERPQDALQVVLRFPAAPEEQR
jgi:2-desacetyl-2-hydroxyethyl bacteriochlorophyllide A dehydrogenase